MSNMFAKTIQLFTGEPVTLPFAPKMSKRPFKKYSERDLLKMESTIGRHLFGPIPEGHQREFFCLDARTWIWYERWIDPTNSEPKEQTTRYEVHSNGIIKIQESQPYTVLEGQELRNLETAVRMYHERVMRDIYKRDPLTGQFLTQAQTS